MEGGFQVVAVLISDERSSFQQARGGFSGPDVEEEEEGKDEKEVEKEQEDDSAASVPQSKATKHTRACTRARTQPLRWKWESAAFNGKIASDVGEGLPSQLPLSAMRILSERLMHSQRARVSNGA